ncbi:DUF4174 domain-containing protein [uncultured Sphingomonas sp.]|uniref:DUF4174 domain-containing protein n=1 Tax=uncultured Sphingomonas sp. TaxID=158754 RepID=UPI0035CA5D90
MNALLAICAALPALAAAPTGIDTMRHHRRILLVVAPAPDDPQLAEQRRLLEPWRAGAADRDLSVVELVGDRVVGATDPAPALRRRFRLVTSRFAVLLIAKDGHVADRGDHPITAEALERQIDAMPMRRAGQR